MMAGEPKIAEKLRKTETETVSPTEEPKIADELKKMGSEAILPIEVKLVGWSLVLGVVLLGILVLLSRWLFPNP
ncbi:MAG: hypothetical protein M1457_13440 [bacterium]|nr:hypothetical protein [bacterium]